MHYCLSQCKFTLFIQLHRLVVYDDYNIHFDGEDLFLHGTFQDASCQRHIIFTGKVLDNTS